MNFRSFGPLLLGGLMIVGCAVPQKGHRYVEIECARPGERRIITGHSPFEVKFCREDVNCELRCKPDPPLARVVEIPCVTAEGVVVARPIGGFPGEWECDRDPACAVKCQKPEPRAPVSWAGTGGSCRYWPRAYSARMSQVKNQHLAWAEAYDLSPETTHCLTNQKALRDQVDQITAGCNTGDRDAESRIADRHRGKCNAFPVE